MSFDEPNFDDGTEAPLPGESNNNRTFMIAVGILGGIILISVACLVGVYLFGRSRLGGTQVAQANANSTATAAAAFISNALTATSQGLLFLPTTTTTPVPTSVVKAATATSTVNPAIAGAANTPAAATATVGAALTQAAAAQLTVVMTTTALPKTGIAEEFGLPGLVVMALAFVIVILLARRLRVAPTLNR
jgi:cytoskeletal protein RodZ